MMHCRSALALLLLAVPGGVLRAQQETATEPAADAGREARLYDLAGLVSDRTGPDLRLQVEGAPALLPLLDDAGPRGIARLLRAFLVPPLRPDEELQPFGERWLVVLARREQHAWIERFLAQARAQPQQTFQVRCGVYRMPPGVYEQDVAPALADGTAQQPGPGTAVLLDPGANTAAFLRGLREHAQIERLQAPAVLVRNLAPASIASLQQTAYVRDFDVKTEQGRVILDPVVDVVQDGLSLQAAVALLPEAGLGLSLEAKIADLQRPIPTFTTTLAGSTVPITVQLPQVASTQVETAAILAPQQTLVLALPELHGRRCIVTVQVEPAAAAAPARAASDR